MPSANIFYYTTYQVIGVATNLRSLLDPSIVYLSIVENRPVLSSALQKTTTMNK